MLGAGHVCRPGAGACDVAEACSGVGAQCPPDAFASAATVCRATLGACDVTESCSGSNAACPPDAKSTATCRAAAGACDVAESCDGIGDACPSDAFVSSATVCRGSSGDCDVAETCTGADAACPSDAKSTATCRAAAGACDVAESCDGASDVCPADAIASAGAVCRPSGDACDLEEACDGASLDCPADTGLPDGDGDAVCDAIDLCPADADPATLDGDGDDLGDACDPCTNAPAVHGTSASLTIRRVGSPVGDESLSFKAKLVLPHPFMPPLDPATRGLRMLLVDALEMVVADVSLPAGAFSPATGAGWISSPTRFTYKNSGKVTPLVGGVNRVTVKDESGRAPGRIALTISAKAGAYPVATLPLRVVLVLAPPRATSAACGEVTFPGGSGPACSTASRGTVVRCR